VEHAPQVVVLETARQRLSGRGRLLAQQLADSHEVAPLQRLVGEVDVRVVEQPAVHRLLALDGDALLLGARALAPGVDDEVGHGEQDDGADGGGAQEAARKRLPLPPDLGPRHLLADPLLVEDVVVDAVPDVEPPSGDAGDPREL
jgi:hypothetical protein